jgi:two-component sensor histidine kinase
MTLVVDDALPLGLMTNELLVNSMKYAYPPEARGQIRLILARDGDRAALSIEDDGAGLPEGIDPAACDSMGFTIVRGLAEQLKGRIEFGGPPGFRVRISFPARGREN